MGTRMRIANMPTQPQQNENHRLVRNVFKRAELLQSSVPAVEHSTYFANGCSPVHAEDDSEEVIYFRRGNGKVLLGTSTSMSARAPPSRSRPASGTRS